MDATHVRNGIVWLGTVMAGATWGQFFSLTTLAAVATGALIALVGLYAVTFTR